MPKQIIHTHSAPTTGFTNLDTPSPLAQAIQAGDFLYVSGQGPLHPETRELVSDDIREQTHMRSCKQGVPVWHKLSICGFVCATQPTFLPSMKPSAVSCRAKKLPAPAQAARPTGQAYWWKSIAWPIWPEPDERSDEHQPAHITATISRSTIRFIEPTMTAFKHIVLYTDTDGYARFCEEYIALPGGTPKALLSELFPSHGFQVRHSPPGVSSDFHCTTTPQWLVVLSGAMEIGLRDGSTRVFRAGGHFFSNDLLPEDASFDPAVHGHRSRVVGDAPLTTLFVRTA